MTQPLTGYENLIAKLDASRQGRGISVREIAQSTGISATFIRDVFHGRKQIGGSRLVALADALGYDLALIPREDTDPDMDAMIAMQDWGAHERNQAREGA